jgi:hypothetical protein
VLPHPVKNVAAIRKSRLKRMMLFLFKMIITF